MMKPPTFYGIEVEDAYTFIIDFHERLYKMGAVERFGVEFVTFQLMEDAKVWWSAGHRGHHH